MKWLDARAKLSQRINQVANRTFAHASIAVQNKNSIAESEKCGQEARCGACIADKEFGFACRDFSAQPSDGHFGVCFIELDVEAEGLQGFGEVTRIIGEEGVGEARGSFAEGRDQ